MIPFMYEARKGGLHLRVNSRVFHDRGCRGRIIDGVVEVEGLACPRLVSSTGSIHGGGPFTKVE